MKSLAAILFHPSATAGKADKADKAQGPKPAASFAQVLQTSLGDSRRDSRPGLAPTAPAESLPETTDTPAPISGAAQDRPSEPGLDPTRAAGGRRDRGRSEDQVAQDSSRPEIGKQDKLARPGQDALRLHGAHRGYAGSPTRQVTEAPSPESPRSESAQGPTPLPSRTKANTGPTDQPSTNPATPDASATQDLPTPSLKPRRFASVDPTPSHPRAAPQEPTRPSTGAAVAKPSNEKTMPANTSAVAQGFTSPGVPSPRSGIQVQPQAWTLASKGSDLPAHAVENPGALAVPAGQLVPVDKSGPTILPEVERSPLPEVGTSLPDKQIPSGPAQRPIRQAPIAVTDSTTPQVPARITQRPAVFHAPLPEGHPARNASSDWMGVPALPERAPVSANVHQAKAHSVSVANPVPPESKIPLPAQANGGDALVVGEPANTDEPPVLTSPRLDPIVIPETQVASEQPSRSRPRPEMPVQSRNVPAQASAPSDASTPKTDRSPPALPDAARSLPHTSVAPTIHAFVQPSTLTGHAEVHTQVLPRALHGHGETTPRTHATLPSEPPEIQDESVVALPRISSPSLHAPAPASRIPEPTPETNVSSPVAQRPRPLPSAKPLANQAAPVAPVAIRTPDVFHAPATRANAQPAASEPATPVLEKLNHGTRGAQLTQPSAQQSMRREGAVDRTTVEASRQSAQATPNPPIIEHQDLDGDLLPDTDSTPGAGTQPPAIQPPKPAVVKAGQDQPAHPITRAPMQDTPVASMGQPPLPLPGTNSATTQTPTEPELVVPAPLAQASARDTVPPVGISFTDPRPTRPRHDGSPQVLLPPSPVSGQAQVTVQPNDQTKPTGPAIANHGVRVAPPAHRSEREPVIATGRPDPVVAPVAHDAAPALPIAAMPSTKPTTVPPVVADSPVAASAPNLPAAPQPATDPATRPAVPHIHQPGPHRIHPKSTTKPVEASAPAPQVESQPEPTSRVESQVEPTAQTTSDDRDDAVAPSATATTAPASQTTLNVPVTPAQPAPAAVTVATVPADQPAQPLVAPAPAAVSAVQAASVPPASNLPPTEAPLAPTLPASGDARAPRRLWTAKDDTRSADEATPPATTPQALPARPHAAPAPTARVSDDTGNSARNQNPHNHASAQPAPSPFSTSDRPADPPAAPAQASPSPSDTTGVTPASVAPSSPAPGHEPPVEVQRPHLPNHVAPMAAQAAPDDGLNMTVMPHSAHMSIESSDGDLALHLRVRHGSADVTMSGSMAPLFEARAPEARAALAGEGLTLGRFDLGQQGGGSSGQQGQPAPERSEHASEPATPYRQQSNHHEPTPGDGRIHVTA